MRRSNSGNITIIHAKIHVFVWDFKLEFQLGEIWIFFSSTFLVYPWKKLPWKYRWSTGILWSIYTSGKGWSILEYTYLLATMTHTHISGDLYFSPVSFQSGRDIFPLMHLQVTFRDSIIRNNKGNLSLFGHLCFHRNLFNAQVLAVILKNWLQASKMSRAFPIDEMRLNPCNESHFTFMFLFWSYFCIGFWGLANCWNCTIFLAESAVHRQFSLETLTARVGWTNEWDWVISLDALTWTWRICSKVIDVEYFQWQYWAVL